MVLCVGIGNTNIRCAVGTKEDNRQISLPSGSVLCAGDFVRALEERLGADIWGHVTDSVVATVVPDKTPAVTGAVRVKTGSPPLRIDTSKLGLDLSRYGGNIGEDRAVCCAAALADHKPPLIVADFGTATTVNFIGADGAFLGGAIAAGVRMGLAALNERTALLPSANDLSCVTLIGSDTRGCLVSGAVIGAAGILEGYVRRAGPELGGTPTVVITGGNAPALLPFLGFEFVYRPSLLTDGLFSCCPERVML